MLCAVTHQNIAGSVNCLLRDILALSGKMEQSSQVIIHA